MPQETSFKIAAKTIANAAVSLFSFSIGLAGTWLSFAGAGMDPTVLLSLILGFSISVPLAIRAYRTWTTRPQIHMLGRLSTVEPADRGTIREMNRLAHEVFRLSQYFLPDERFEAFFERSPTGFHMLRRQRDGRLVGFYTVFPLVKTAADRVKRGDLLVPELTPEMVTTPWRATCLHIVDVISIGTKTESGVLLLHLSQFVRSNVDRYPRIEFVSSHSINDESADLLRSHGFVDRDAERCDRSGRRLWVLERAGGGSVMKAGRSRTRMRRRSNPDASV